MKIPTTIGELRKALPGIWFEYGIESGTERRIFFGVKGDNWGRRSVIIKDCREKVSPTRREVIAAAYAAAKAFEDSK